MIAPLFQSIGKMINMRKFLILLKFSLAAVILLLLIKSSLLNFKLLLALFYKPLQLSYVLFLLLINILLSAWRWYRLNSFQRLAINYVDTINATYIGLTFNYLLPGSVGGDLVRINYLFKRLPQKKIDGAFSVFADRLFGLMGVFLTLAAMGFFYQDVFKSTHYLLLLLLACIWLPIMIVMSIFLVIKYKNFILTTVKTNTFMSKQFSKLFGVIEFYKKMPYGLFIECIAVSILIQILLGYITFVIGKILGLNVVSFLCFLTASLIVQVASIVPISPGGIGVSEMAFAKTIILLNPQAPAAYATIYIAFRLIYMISTAPGILLFLHDKPRINSKRAAMISSETLV